MAKIMRRPESHAGLTTGERIRLLRERAKMRRTNLAEVVGISAKQLGRYERDESAPPGDVVRNLALALETTTDYLLMLSDDPTIPDGDLPTRVWSNPDVLVPAA